jgi:hypothetical protein
LVHPLFGSLLHDLTRIIAGINAFLCRFQKKIKFQAKPNAPEKRFFASLLSSWCRCCCHQARRYLIFSIERFERWFFTIPPQYGIK